MAGGGDNGAIMSDSGIIETVRAEACKPWLRHDLSTADWADTARAAAAECRVLLAHWADADRVYALFLDPEAGAALPVSTAVEGGAYPALSPVLPDAALSVRGRWASTARPPGWKQSPPPLACPPTSSTPPRRVPCR